MLLAPRYFKQIAKSVRANGSASSGSEENADDFLGCINIPLSVSAPKTADPVGVRAGTTERVLSLQEMPVVGHDTWFKLEPRSSTSKVQGECHLILKLFTNQVCGRRHGTPAVGGGVGGDKPLTLFHVGAEGHDSVEERLQRLHSPKTADSDLGVRTQSGQSESTRLVVSFAPRVRACEKPPSLSL